MKGKDNEIRILENRIEYYKFFTTYLTFFLGIILIIIFRQDGDFIDRLFTPLLILYLIAIAIVFTLAGIDYLKINKLLQER